MGFDDYPPILRKDSSDTEWTLAKTCLIVFMSVMNVFMFLGNLLSLVTIGSNAKLRQQVSYWFVMNLAIIDLLISVTVVPLNTIWEYYGTWPFNRVTCEFFTFADIAFSTVSAYSIVLVSIDKYFYINFSIQYFDKMTRKMAVAMIITVWISVFIFATISILTEVGTNEKFKDHFLTITNATETCIFVMTDEFVIPSAVISFFLPFGILCFTSSRIVCIASKHIRKIHTISNSLTSDTDSETIKMSRNKPKGNTLTGTTIESSNASRVNQQNSIKLTASPLAITTSNSTNQAADENTHQQEILDPHVKEPNVTPDCSQNESQIMQYDSIDKTTSSNSTNTNCSVQSLNNVKLDECIERTVQTTDLSSNSPSQQQGMRRLRSQSTRSKVKNSESLRSVTLKKSESMKSVGVMVHKKKSPYCKLFGTVTIVIACFILMFAPYNIAIMVDVWCHCIQPWVYEDILAVLYYMHSLVNPYIYMATDRKYKAALRLLWRRVNNITICCKGNNA